MKNGALFDDLPDWIPVEAWQGWLDMRRQKRIPTTERAKRQAVMTLTMLKEKGENLEHVLGQSEFQGWAGLFAVSDAYYQMLGIPKPINKSAVILKMTDRTWAERS